jgi:ATP-dependent phosphofructokinase / diphosphate-dependent phosphofructokinase
MSKQVGILTAGGDSPGLNAAIRGVGKAAIGAYGMDLIGFRDGFRGLMQDRIMRLDGAALSDILTRGGTILGASRDKPHRMPVGGQSLDMTDVMLNTYRKHHLDVLVCLGGGGTQKNALRLQQKGLNVITLPKTIDNDVALTDVTFGFDTALGVATEAVDRLHSTAHSHHRIIVVEIMGHQAGWLALGAGIAGGADVILIPEITYDVNAVAEAIRNRSRQGKQFSIVALSEGAMSKEDAAALREVDEQKKNGRKKGPSAANLAKLELRLANRTLSLSKHLEELTGLESRVTILGHLQRGGAPSAADRLLATRLGTACADLIERGVYGVMVAARGESAEPVPLEEAAGKRKIVPLDHPWVESARKVGTCLGD